jgi:hypothetical protein
MNISREQTIAIAKSAGDDIDHTLPSDIDFLHRFHNAAIAAYKAELLKGAGEPVGEVTHDAGGRWGNLSKHAPIGTKLYTSDQMIAAILKATKPLEEELTQAKDELAMTLRVSAELRAQLATAQEEIAFQKSAHEQAQQLLLEQGDQLAKAEQRVVEACALTYLEDYDLTDIADRIRAGEWRKFVKEV